MALLGFLDKSDPSDNWPQRTLQPLALDLRSRSLNGIQLGVPASQLARFGRPTNKRPFKNKRFEYRDAGLVVEIEDDAVSYFGLIIEDANDEGVSGCRFTLIALDGTNIDFASGAKWSDVEPNLPTATREADADETIYTMNIAGDTLEFECSPAGAIRRVNLYRSE